MPGIRAAVMPRPGAPMEVRELPAPELASGDALLEVEYSEVCGTDVHLREGRLAGVPYPLVPGHVSVGRLARIRDRITDVEGNLLEEGRRVTFLDVFGTCGACWYCLVAKATTRCPARRVYGITFGESDGPSGGWAEAIHLRAGTRIVPLDDVPVEAFMAGGCGLPTAFHAVERAGIEPSETVLVLGTGPVGLSAVILAVLRGAAAVLAIGGPGNRIETARAVGAADALDIGDAAPAARAAWVLDRTGGRGADVTIEATGSPEAVVQAMRCTRDAGRVVVAGQYTDAGDVAFNPHADLNRKHLDVLGCWGSDFSHFHRGIRLLADPERRRAWTAIPLARFGLAQTDEALDAVAAGRVVKALIEP